MPRPEPEVLNAKLMAEPNVGMFLMLYPSVKPDVLLSLLRLAYALGRVDGNENGFIAASKVIGRVLGATGDQDGND